MKEASESSDKRRQFGLPNDNIIAVGSERHSSLKSFNNTAEREIDRDINGNLQTLPWTSTPR